MDKIAGYILQQKLSESRNSVIYLGHKDGEPRRLLIKLLKAINPIPSEIARFMQEYELIKNSDLEGIVKTFDIINIAGDFALVTEDFDGVPLCDLAGESTGIGLQSFLNIARKTAEILGNLHRRGIIHRSIKPLNILLNSETGTVKLTNFGISSILTRENDEVYNPEFITGTLVYMSPEQTGRINRSVDYRTDMYSLGVALYELLTGTPPFISDDPMELIHSHIAVMPESPSKLDGSIPEAVSNIIMKMLSKSPEERYQNSFGLMADLAECSRRLDASGRIDNFTLAAKDISIKLNIPQIIVGRERESEILFSAFERSAGGESVMQFVLGHPGIGKSALIFEIQRPILEKKGYFIFGKYEKLRKDVPYSSIIQAFQGLIKQLISESDMRIGIWRERLQSALEPNGKVITDVIPDLEFIIGKQPVIEQLDPEESQNRFNMVFLNFIKVFTTAEHPMTLFLDDLQWADLASLKLLKEIMVSPSIKFLLLICTYRDGEITPYHPLSITLDEIQGSGKKINSLSLAPLNTANVNKIIMNVLRCSEEKSLDLAELIHKKTGGNPFFINQFMKNLYDNKVIELDTVNGWTWDLDRIREMQFTDNVVEFMAARILNLPEKTREILKVCACIGNRFDLETLAIVLDKTIGEVLTDITAAIRCDLVNLYGNLYKFHHDRIQEAAYSIIPDHEKTRLHYLIGKNVLENTPEKNLPDKMFYIVDQLNLGLNLISNLPEKLHLAEMNLKAAEKAKNSTAYASALNYAGTGIKLLPGDSWNDLYRLTYSLYNELLECRYLTGEYEQAEKTFRIIVQNALTDIDKANVHSQMIILKNSTGDYESALRIGFAGMKIIGMGLPEKVGNIRLAFELLKLGIRFRKVRIEDLAEIPDAVDEQIISFAYLCIYTGIVAYFINVNLFSFIVIRGINLIIKNGNFEYSSFAYNAIGSIIGSGFGLYSKGYRFGKTSLVLYNRMGGIKNRCKSLFLFAFFIHHWKEHAATGLNYLREAYKAGLLAGDLIFAGYSISVLTMHRIMLGDNLDEILDEYIQYREYQVSARDPFTPRIYSEIIQMIRCLKGQTPARGELDEGRYTEDEQMKFFVDSGNTLGQVYTLMDMLRVRYLFRRYDECSDICLRIFKLIKNNAAIGTLHIPEFYFYYSLQLAASLENRTGAQKIRSRARLKINQMKMKNWAKNCPANFEHKYLLVEAELARLDGKHKKAVSLYEKAIRSAQENRFTQNEAIANELAGRFYISIGFEKVGKSYIDDAYRCYVRWGASSKLSEMQEFYPHLAENRSRSIPVEDNQSGIAVPGTGITSSTLDISTIIKVSQAISSEIILSRLIRTIMKIAVVNAGAQKGFFILDTDGILTIEAAEEEGREETLSSLQSLPPESCDEVSAAIINYVHRSGENVILGNASTDGPFTNDPHVIKYKCKSILCTPFRSKGKISGILYMENNITYNAFTSERLEPLRIISSQAAISIENARLFELATTDGMTRLYVHRYFQLLLEQEIQRSRRHNRQFSLIMMDIDNFKSFNDTYGHQTGDEVLKNVARAVKKISRGEDVVARYGGEEFVVILPEMDSRKAMIVAEKIRATVENLEISYGTELLHVTISLGVAAFPGHSKEKDELIRLADEALYRSKRSGKNCVTLYQS